MDLIFDFGHSSVDFSRHPSIQIQALMELRARGLIGVGFLIPRLKPCTCLALNKESVRRDFQ